ncbi:MAG: VWA domain-containing protein [Acidobacteriota bacterium]|jgi:Ca-activated chloride channel family protein
MNQSTQIAAAARVRKFGLPALGLLILAAAAIMAPRLSWSQSQQSQNPPVTQQQQPYQIKSEVNLVTVPVTVRKPTGGFVKALPKTAFHITEDGDEQEILTFEQEGLPTHIAIVLDISGSVRPEWGTIKYATKKFVENLKSEDQFSIVVFNTQTILKMDWGNKTDRLEDVLTSIYCKDNTNLWDSVYVVANDVFKGIQEKKAMIIMTDGLDNNSSMSYKDCLDAAVHSEAAVYVVSKTQAVRQAYLAAQQGQGVYTGVPEQEFIQADMALRKLAYETGGRVLYPNTFGQLDNIYAEVDEELRNQYTLGYISTNTAKDGSYRRIEVKVDAPEATVSARPGYYAPKRK